MRRRRRWCWVALSAVAVAVACAREPVDRPPPKPLNVLLILVDDLRPDLGAYGHPQIRTPAIDDLAVTGIRFDRAYAQYPACNPSRTSMLTGLRPDTTGVIDNQTPFQTRIPDAITLPRLFRDAGYFTASIGKIFHGAGRDGAWIPPATWDVVLFPRAGGAGRHKHDWTREAGRVGRYAWRSIREGGGALTDERVADRAVQILGEKRERPFFVAVGFSATHPHFEAPESDYSLYPIDSIPLPPTPPSEMRALQAALHGWSDENDQAFSERQKRELIRAYQACVSYVDAQVARVLAALTRFELDDDTIVVLTSDHGFHLGEQGWWAKHTLFEAATRVPLIVRAPGRRRGDTSSGLIELLDLYPTLAELTGLEVPERIDGRSFVSLLDDPDRAAREAVFSQVSLGRVTGHSVRTDRWRYTEWTGERSAIELYDLGGEPSETQNLASDPRTEVVQQRLRALLRPSPG